MLLNSLYTIDNLQNTQATIRADLRFNPEHPIFAGHFPGRPILPGACQVQLIRELLSHTSAKDFRLQQATSIKFLSMIDPREQDTLQMTLRYESDPAASAPEKWQVSAALTAGDTVFLKFSGIFAAG